MTDRISRYQTRPCTISAIQYLGTNLELVLEALNGNDITPREDFSLLVVDKETGHQYNIYINNYIIFHHHKIVDVLSSRSFLNTFEAI